MNTFYLKLITFNLFHPYISGNIISNHLVISMKKENNFYFFLKYSKLIQLQRFNLFEPEIIINGIINWLWLKQL